MKTSPMEVAVAVIEKGGRYLIAQRMPSDSFGGIWEFPGGKTDSGEPLEDCLVREMKEELGITIAVGQKLQEIEHRYPTRTIHLHCFACRIVEGEPQAIECAAWRWVSAEELKEFQFPPASGPLIAQLQGRHCEAPPPRHCNTPPPRHCEAPEGQTQSPSP